MHKKKMMCLLAFNVCEREKLVLKVELKHNKKGSKRTKIHCQNGIREKYAMR